MLKNLSQPRPVVRFAQLCAIAKDQFQPDGGWKDAVMWRCARLGFATPEPEQVRKAMDAVMHAHKLQYTRPTPAPPPAAAPFRELSPAEASAALQRAFSEIRLRFPHVPIAGPKGF